jgi:hypothetical protein
LPVMKTGPIRARFSHGWVILANCQLLFASCYCIHNSAANYIHVLFE